VHTLTQLVEGRLGRLQLDIHLKDRPYNHREKSESHVVESDRPRKPKRLTWAHIIETVRELDSSKDHVFVEKVENHLSDPHVVQPPII
jgi:hypothetical protein